MHVCPYWSFSAKNCLVSKQGLYLPVQDHVYTFCRTENHLFCPRFEQQDAELSKRNNISGKIVDRRDKAGSDRRGTTRIFGCLPLEIKEVRNDGRVPSLYEKTAVTVDLSADGIRLQSRCAFPVDSLVFFSLDDPSGSPVRGTGRIKWCLPRADGSLFHAGMVFTDNSTPGVMRRYLASSFC